MQVSIACTEHNLKSRNGEDRLLSKQSSTAPNVVNAARAKFRTVAIIARSLGTFTPQHHISLKESTAKQTGMKYSFSGAKEWIFRLTSFFCSFMVWGFGITLATSRFWRLWEFNHKTIKVVFIGLWEAYYYQDFNVSGTMKKIAVHSHMNSSWTIPAEIEYARGLVTLANAFQPVVLIFSSLAIMACWIQAPYPEFMIMCYKTSILFLILSNVCILIAVTWNYTADLYGESTLDLPATFPVSKEERVKKESIHVFKLGILTAILSFLSIIMLFYEMWLVKPKGKVKPLEAAKNSPRRA